jgi:hypothetical protein
MSWTKPRKVNKETEYIKLYTQVSLDINERLNIIRESENLTKTEMAMKWKENEGESQMTGTCNFTLMELSKIGHYINERLIFSSLEYNALEEEIRILKAEIERLKS